MLAQRINYGQYQECKLRFGMRRLWCRFSLFPFALPRLIQVLLRIWQRENSCLEGGIGRKGSVCCFCLILLHSGKILEMRVSYILLLGNKQTFCQKNFSAPLTLGGLSLCIEIMPKTTSPETPFIAGVRLNASWASLSRQPHPPPGGNPPWTCQIQLWVFGWQIVGLVGHLEPGLSALGLLYRLVVVVKPNRNRS